jgi:hypothetical protein
MAAKITEEIMYRFLLVLKNPIVLVNFATAWITFSVLNRPVGEPRDEIFNFTWSWNLFVAIFLTIWSLLLGLKIIF